MRLQAHTQEAARSLNANVECSDVSDIDPRLRILRSDSDTMAVVALLIGKRWRILLEDSIYEPTGEPFNEETEAPPFCTEGEMWSVDPETGLVGQEHFSFSEGEIQGLLYALEAAAHGGILTPKQYIDYLIEQYVRLDAASMGDEAELLAYDRPSVIADHNTKVVDMLVWAELAHPIKREVTTGFSF